MADRDEINVQLPRALVGGLRKAPVEDLLRRIAHDYEQLEIENKRLWATLGQLGQVSSETQNDVGSGTEDSGLDAGVDIPFGHRLESVEETWPQELFPPAAATSNEPAGSEIDEQPDLAAAVLLVAQRAANELRESARAECELMIKKARSHLDKLERESEHSRAATAAELAELQAMRGELRDHMRGSLQALLRTFVAERSGNQRSFEWREPPVFLDPVFFEPGSFEPPDPDRSARKKKKHKS